MGVGCIVLCVLPVRTYVCRMASLLKKFRISFSEVIEVTGINQKPSKERSVLWHIPSTHYAIFHVRYVVCVLYLTYMQC